MYLGERSPSVVRVWIKDQMTKRATLKDIARQTGVTYQTVSKILRSSNINVTPELRQRVESTAAELGYVPNVTARNLRARSSYLIGYSWQLDPPDHVNPVLEQFLQSIVDSSERAGYHVLLFPQRPGEDVTTSYAELTRTGRVDGFILSSLNYDDPRIPVLQELRVPFVAFGRCNVKLPHPYVDLDNRAGMRMAVEHLLEQGHRRIAVIAWPEDSRVGTERLEGYVDAMNAAGLSIRPEWVIRGEGVYEYGYNAALSLLSLPQDHRPTAIVTLVDLIAIGAMHAVEECGFRVGRDIAITGFDDEPIIQYLRPALTSLRQPAWEIGQRVVEMLVALLERNPPDVQQMLLPPRLMVRDSSISSEVVFRA
jgi:DNA-binding LacI/PurR family transcriptional regulator